MINTCPKCGGSNLRPITPGYFECLSPVTVGVIQHPGGMGPMPAVAECGHHFQTGATSASGPCGCGRDSIGSCTDCGRRLCGLHGTTKGPFLCAECFNARHQREVAYAGAAAEQARAAAAQKEQDRAARRNSMTARLAVTQNPHEIAALVIENEADITDEASRDAWVRLVNSGIIDPTHDIVTAVGRQHLLVVGNFCNAPDPGWGWRETGRVNAWCAHDDTAPDRWLEANGRLWLPDRSSGGGALTAGQGERNHIALLRGRPFIVSKSPGSFGLVHYAGSVSPRSAVGGVVLSESAGGIGHARTVASILRTKRPPNRTNPA